VLKDYVAAILNTPRADSEWWLNLGAEIKTGGQRLERGTGSVVSTEFAVLYHWHAALSAADDQWMEDIIREAIPELKDIDDMTPEMMTRVYMVFGHKFAKTPAKEWTFGGLERGEGGKFSEGLYRRTRTRFRCPWHTRQSEMRRHHGYDASTQPVQCLHYERVRE
jgi:hypothetical protein